jgi:hypothetical protein
VTQLLQSVLKSAAHPFHHGRTHATQRGNQEQAALEPNAKLKPMQAHVLTKSFSLPCWCLKRTKGALSMKRHVYLEIQAIPQIPERSGKAPDALCDIFRRQGAQYRKIAHDAHFIPVPGADQLKGFSKVVAIGDKDMTELSSRIGKDDVRLDRE